MKKIFYLLLLCATTGFVACEKTTPTTPPEETTVSVTGVTLDKEKITIDKGGKATLTATVLPENATNKNVRWTTSNFERVEVSSTGVITGLKDGIATITVTTEDNNKTATCDVTVKVPSSVFIKSLEFEEPTLTLKKGEKKTLTPIFNPTNTTNKLIEWKSLKSSIASVSETGEVTAVGVGTTDIVATSKANTGVTATCTVTVTE